MQQEGRADVRAEKVSSKRYSREKQWLKDNKGRGRGHLWSLIGCRGATE